MLRRLVVRPLLLLLAASQPALAGTDTDQLTVTATVQSGCSLTGGSLSFGEYTSGQASDLDAVGTISYVNCSGTLTFALDGGLSGNVSARQMRSGANRLSYQLYRNSTRNAIWGSGADAHGVILLTPQSGSIQVFGRVLRSQTVPDGVYTDTVTITLTF
ncbi:MAG: spore coat U domain-containing protein [Geminicoccaceae bacterium]